MRRISTVYGPDERCYWSAVETLHDKGWRGFRSLAERFVTDPGAAAYPSPIRWLWLAINWAARPLGRHAVPIASAALVPVVAGWLIGAPAAIVAATSPLLWAMGRRTLQDATVALATLLGVGAAASGSPVALGVALLAMLGLKEATVCAFPAIAAAWLLAGHPVVPALLAGIAALACFLAVSRGLLGPALWPLLRALWGGHETDYTRAHQRGDWHRLLVDLVLVSPVPALLWLALPGPMTIPAALLVAGHAVSPIRNVRTVLAADILIRGTVAVGLLEHVGWIGVIALALVDALAIRRLRGLYDPVTANLTNAFGMAR